MDLRKLKQTKEEEKAIKELSKKLSKYLGEDITIGKNAVRRHGPKTTTVETIREWFRLGRESMSTLHDEDVQ